MLDSQDITTHHEREQLADRLAKLSDEELAALDKALTDSPDDIDEPHEVPAVTPSERSCGKRARMTAPSLTFSARNPLAWRGIIPRMPHYRHMPARSFEA